MESQTQQHTRTPLWALYALLAMLCATVYTLLIKASSAMISPLGFLSGVFIVQVLFLCLESFRRGTASARTMFFEQSRISVLLCLVCGMFGALGNLFEVYAIEKAPNVGYVSALKLGQILIVTSLGDKVSGTRNTKASDLLWSLGVILGIFLVTGVGFQLESIDQNTQWIWYSFGAMLSFSLMILLTKYISRLMEAHALTFWFIFATSLYLVGFGYSDLCMSLMSSDWTFFVMLIAAGISAGIFNLMFTKSVALSPNPGFSTSINSLQIPLITIGGLLLFENQTISLAALAGGVIALLSAIKIATAERKG